jgi:thiol-disulfide isomerase/thioredoxin
MKTALIITFCLASSTVGAQTNTKVTGKLKGLKAGTVVYLSPASPHSKKDSVVAGKGRFKFNLSLEEGDLYSLKIGKEPTGPGNFNLTAFYLQPGKVKLKGKATDMPHAKLSGSKFVDEQNDLKNYIAKGRKKYESDLTNFAEAVAKRDSARIAALNPINIEWGWALKELYREWFMAHPSSPVSAMVLIYNIHSLSARKKNLDEWQKDLDHLHPEAKRNALAKRMLREIRINRETDSLKLLSITGSSLRLQKEAEAYLTSVKNINDQETAISQQFKKVSEDEQKVLREKLERLKSQKKEILIQHISAHPKSNFSVSLIADKALMTGMEYPDIKPLVDLLDPAMLQTAAGKRLSERLAQLKRRTPGEPMLNFTQNSASGRPVHFADFKGKYVFVDFWASWCKPCRAENPNVLAAYNRYKDKNFTVLGIALDEKEDMWKKAIQDDKLPWTQVSDLKGMDNEVAVYYGIRGIPSTLLVGPDGKIIAKDLHGKALHKKLAELLDK